MYGLGRGGGAGRDVLLITTLLPGTELLPVSVGLHIPGCYKGGCPCRYCHRHIGMFSPTISFSPQTPNKTDCISCIPCIQVLPCDQLLSAECEWQWGMLPPCLALEWPVPFPLISLLTCCLDRCRGPREEHEGPWGMAKPPDGRNLHPRVMAWKENCPGMLLGQEHLH